MTHSIYTRLRSLAGKFRLTIPLILLATMVPAWLGAQDCAPQWTAGVDLIRDTDTTSLTIIVDTSATSGFDEGLDVLCAADTTVDFACLLSEGMAFEVLAIPSEGESPIFFTLEIETDAPQTEFDWNLGTFPLDSASVSYVIDGDTTVLDLLGYDWFMLDSTVTPALMSGVLWPSCAVPGCTDETACNYDPGATEDDGSCTFPYFCFDCDGNCLCDEDADGVCDPLEFPGCTDPDACNWAPVYTEEDGSCFYAQPGFDCAGFCLPVDNDECGFAEPIACSQIVQATTVCADTTESDYCDQYNIGQYYHGGLWYSIMGTGDTLRATMCFEDTDYDTYLSVYEGDCDDLICVAGNDDQDETNFFADPCFENFLSSSADWESEEGVEYFLHVSGSNAVTPAVGGFEFVLVCDGIEVGTCLDSLACNYNPFGTFDDGSCDYAICAGCGLFSACNYDSTAFINDLSLCDFGCYGCTDAGACNFNPEATIESGLCEYNSCAGCLDPLACNHDTTAVLDAGNCEYTSCVGCTDPDASNYNAGATEEDGSCTYCDLMLMSPMVTDESCYAAADGGAMIVLDSALTDSVYFELTAPGFALSDHWSDGAFTDLAPGNYLLEVFDGDSTCSAVTTFSVAASPDIALFAVATSPLCAGGDDGAISAFTADGITANGYSLDGGAGTLDDTFTGLSAGSYLLEVETTSPSGAMCMDSVAVQVVDPAGMMVTVEEIEGADADEENGGISVTVTGGQEPYDFEWSGPTGTTGMEDPDDLGAGDWTLTVTDGDGCTVDTTISVPVGMTEWTAPVFTLMPNPTRSDYRIQFEQPFDGRLVLTDMTGRMVDMRDARGTVFSGTLADRPAGVYMLKALDDRGSGTVVRLVKQD